MPNFTGNEWRVVGGTATALVSNSTLSIRKHCLGFSADGNPFFSILEGDDIVVVSWNGVSWIKGNGLGWSWKSEFNNLGNRMGSF